MLPKIVFTDIDGVWTDGGMYYDQTGNELKKFNTTDSAGVLFLHELGIPVCIITGEETRIVSERAKKLKIDYLIQGTRDKLNDARELLDKLNLDIKDAAFIGDDLNDVELLRSVGISAVPSSSPDYLKEHASLVIDRRGGEGAFRCFVEKILEQNGVLDTVINRIIAR